MDETRLHRRVVGWHDIRLDGLMDLVIRAQGASVLDVGCNRGLVGFEMANNGARLVHGCDNYVEGIQTARNLFCDLRNVESQFEVVDLRDGPSALAPFGDGGYDMVLFLATDHKLRRPSYNNERPAMTEDEIAALFRHLGTKTLRYFAYRQNLEDFARADEYLGSVGLRRIATSEISAFGPTGIWMRG